MEISIAVTVLTVRLCTEALYMCASVQTASKAKYFIGCAFKKMFGWWSKCYINKSTFK